MCVIVIKPANLGISREDMDAMYEQNPHGVGISYYNPEKNKIIWFKGLTDRDEIFNIIEKLKHLEIIVHFRYATSGPITKELCHPFPIREENRLSGESDAIFYQNGEIKAFEPIEDDPEFSDAYIFWLQVINKLDIPLSKEIKEYLNDDINKMIIHNTTNGIDTIGEFYPWNGLQVSNLKFTRFLFEKTKIRKVLSFCKGITLKIIDTFIKGLTKIKEKIE